MQTIDTVDPRTSAPSSRPDFSPRRGIHIQITENDTYKNLDLPEFLRQMGFQDQDLQFSIRYIKHQRLPVNNCVMCGKALANLFVVMGFVGH